MPEIIETYHRVTQDGTYAYHSIVKKRDSIGRIYWLMKDDVGDHRGMRIRSDVAHCRIFEQRLYRKCKHQGDCFDWCFKYDEEEGYADSRAETDAQE